MAHPFEWMTQRGTPSRRAPSVRLLELRLSNRTLLTRARLVRANVVLAWRRITGVEGPSLPRRLQWQFGHLGHATAIRRGALPYERARLVGRVGRSRGLWATAGRPPTH